MNSLYNEKVLFELVVANICTNLRLQKHVSQKRNTPRENFRQISKNEEPQVTAISTAALDAFFYS